MKHHYFKRGWQHLPSLEVKTIFFKMVVWWVEKMLGKNGGEVLILRSHLCPPPKKTIAVDVVFSCSVDVRVF